MTETPEILADEVQVVAANVATDFTPGPAWVRLGGTLWVAPLGTEPLSETYATNWGRMSMADARWMVAEEEHEEERNQEEARRLPASEPERLGATVDADLVRAVVVQAVSTEAQPDVITPTIGQGLRAVAQLIRSLHKATADQFHLELGVCEADCPVCVAVDTQRRRERLYPGRLNQVEAELAPDLARDIPRQDLLEILIGVDRSEAWLLSHGRPNDPYAVAVDATDRLMSGYSLGDVARVVRALRRIREMEQA